jgi:hypothetical protein
VAEQEGKCLTITRGGVPLLQNILQYREPRENRGALDNFGDVRRAEKLLERLEDEFADQPPEDAKATDSDEVKAKREEELKAWFMRPVEIKLKSKEIDTIKKAFHFQLSKKDFISTIHLATLMEQLELVKPVKITDPAQHKLEITRAGMVLLHASLMSKPWTDKLHDRYIGSLIVEEIETNYAGQKVEKDATAEQRKAFAEQLLVLNLTERARDVCKQVFSHYMGEKIFAVDKHTVRLGEQLGFTEDDE